MQPAGYKASNDRGALYLRPAFYLPYDSKWQILNFGNFGLKSKCALLRFIKQVEINARNTEFAGFSSEYSNRLSMVMYWVNAQLECTPETGRAAFFYRTDSHSLLTSLSSFPLTISIKFEFNEA